METWEKFRVWMYYVDVMRDEIGTALTFKQWLERMDLFRKI